MLWKHFPPFFVPGNCYVKAPFPLLIRYSQDHMYQYFLIGRLWPRKWIIYNFKWLQLSVQYLPSSAANFSKGLSVNLFFWATPCQAEASQYVFNKDIRVRLAQKSFYDYPIWKRKTQYKTLNTNQTFLTIWVYLKKSKIYFLKTFGPNCSMQML